MERPSRAPALCPQNKHHDFGYFFVSTAPANTKYQIGITNTE